jgi:DNA-directed RNA polymerase delta subunit
MTTPKLLLLKDVLLLSPSKIQQQIEVREKLIHEMVGTLYPRILQDEITALNSQFWKLRRCYPFQSKISPKEPS